MPDTPNGLRLRFTEYRAQRGLVIEQQALALRSSAATISAIETGQERPPPGYIEEAARWLGLSETETAELLSLSARPRKRVQPRLRHVHANEGAFDTPDKRRLEKFSALKQILASNKQHDPLDAAAAGALTREYLQIAGQPKFDLLEVFENWLPLTDNSCGLRIKPDYRFGDYATGYTDEEVYLSNHTYSNVHKRQADATFIFGHEIGHSVLHMEPRPFVSANHLKSPNQKWTEKEADTFAMALFIPKSAIQEATNSRHLAWLTNTPIKFAHQWTAQTNSAYFWDRLEERKKQLDAQIEEALKSSTRPVAQQQTEENATPWRAILGAPGEKPRKRSRLRSSMPAKSFQAELPFPQSSKLPIETGQTFSEWHTSTEFKEVFHKRQRQLLFPSPPVSRSVEWFRTHGWR